MGTSVHERGSAKCSQLQTSNFVTGSWIRSLGNCSAINLGISSKLSLTIRWQHIESVTVVKQLWYGWFRTGNIRGIHAGEIEAILSTDMSKTRWLCTPDTTSGQTTRLWFFWKRIKFNEILFRRKREQVTSGNGGQQSEGHKKGRSSGILTSLCYGISTRMICSIFSVTVIYQHRQMTL